VTTLTDKKPELAIGPSSLASPACGRSATSPWDRAWDWLALPTHYRAVRRLRSAIENRDSDGLGRLLAAGVAVVVEAGDPQPGTRRVVVGAYEASALLLHGMGARAGVSLDVRSINGQAGLLLTDRGHTTAAIAVDFTGRRITMVWIRLHPHVLRHWNRV
jgi:hypothetical protein